VPVEHLQKVITMALELSLLEKLKSALSPSDCARLLSTAGKNAALWLTTVPSSHELEMTDAQFSLAVRHLLGLPPAEGLPEVCACDQPLLPDHFHSCVKLRKTAVNTRHNMVLHCLRRLAQEAGGNMEIEPKIGGGSRRTDGYYLGFRQVVHVDVGITHPGAATHLAKAARWPGHAAAAYERVKVKDYAEAAQAEGAPFCPFIVESHGTMGARCRDLLKIFAQDAGVNGFALCDGFEGEQRFIARALRLISFTLQRGNAFVGGRGCAMVNRHALPRHSSGDGGGGGSDDGDGGGDGNTSERGDAGNEDNLEAE
jgi:hypothetical protein